MIADYLGARTVPARLDSIITPIRACPSSALLEHIRAGEPRALAVTTATRAQALPQIPAVGDFAPGYETSSWHRSTGIGNARSNA